MKTLLTFLMLAVSVSSFGSTGEVKKKMIQEWILEAIADMPKQGGYELTSAPVKKLRDAFTWDGEYLFLDSSQTTPSYCTTATYQVFYKVLERYWEHSNTNPDRLVLERLKPNLENDGNRIWGRWNSNGPGTAKFFFDAKLGTSFDDIKLARPGDFLKIFWNNHVGKLEKGHSVIYLGQEVVGGVPMIRVWGSHKNTNGYAERLIPKTEAIRVLFSRLESPQYISHLMSIPENDSFLASMLTKASSWSEVRRVSGIK